VKDGYYIMGYPGTEVPNEVRNLILARWMRSLWTGNDYFRLMDRPSYFKRYNDFVKSILARPDCWVRVAVLNDDPDVILGFSVGRSPAAGDILDYIHVHKDQRRQGIGASLVPKGTTTITHLTRTGLTIWGSLHPEWKFDPFA
jgi:hypothetical protein